MEHIGVLLFLAGGLGIVLSLRRLGGRKSSRTLPRDFDFSQYKRDERFR